MFERGMIDFNGKQHISLYLCFAVVYFLPYPDAPLLFFLGGLVGCLLPDVDHKQSIAGHVIPLYLVFKHGKQTHTLATSSIFLIAYWCFDKNDFWYGLWFGFTTHLVGDNLQGNNLKYLYWPFKRRK